MARAGALLLLCCGIGACSADPPEDKLSADQGAALLKDIRKDKTRIKNLTPAEREFLKEKLNR